MGSKILPKNSKIMVPATRFELARIAPVEIVLKQLKSTALNRSATPVLYNIEAATSAPIIYYILSPARALIITKASEQTKSTTFA